VSHHLDTTMSEAILSDSAYSHEIDEPIQRVDIADWLFHLPNAEFQRCCPPEHIAGGTSTTDDGRPMQIVIEQIGDNLIIQQYVGEITESAHCRLVSLSDVFSPMGRTKLGVVWDLRVEPIGEDRCEFTDRVTLTATEEMLAALEQQGVPFEQAAIATHEGASAHNRKETPLYAQSIARHARAHLAAV